MKHVYFSLKLVAASMLQISCLAFTPAVWSMDLIQAYQAALDNDANYAVAKATMQAKAERLPQAKAQLMPSVSASWGKNRNSLDSSTPNFLGQTTNSHRNYTSSNQTISIRQPLFRMYQLADYKQAQEQVNEANAVLSGELNNLAVRVSGAYFEAIQAQQTMAFFKAQKRAYLTQLDAAQKRFVAGVGIRTDIDEAKAAVDLNSAQELEAMQQSDLALRQLQMMVQKPVDRLLTLSGEKMTLTRPLPDDLDHWVALAENKSPEIESLKAQILAAGFEVEKAKAGHLPTLDAVVQLARTANDSVTNTNSQYNNKSIGLQLNIPLYSGGYTSSVVRQALAAQERATLALEALRQDLSVRVHREYRGVTEGVLTIAALEQAVKSAQAVVTSNRRSFEAGSRTLMDTLNAEQQKVAAQRDLSRARLMYMLSRIKLQALVNGPMDEVLAQLNTWFD